MSSEKKTVSTSIDAESEQDYLKYTKAPWYLRVPFASTYAPPPSGTMADAQLIPEATSSIFSKLTFQWLTHLLAVGYARPLVPTDLYKLQDDRSSVVIGDKIVASFERRKKIADEYNMRLASGAVKPSLWKSSLWTIIGNREKRENEWREEYGRRKPSLVMAMNDSIKWWFWSSAALKIVADTAQITSPLLVQAIIQFAQTSYNNHFSTPPQPTPSIGKGVGLAFGLLALQILTSFCTHHHFYRSFTSGVLLRGGLIAAIYSRSLRLTSSARSGSLSNGKLMNHISTDVSRVDFVCHLFHISWTAPIQMIVCLVLLWINIGPSALAGFAVFLLMAPVQTKFTSMMARMRQKSMVWTDKRAKLLQELLGGIRIIKFFAWEKPFLSRIADFRSKEIRYIRTLLLFRSANAAVASSLPVLASVISFVAYSLSGHALEPSVIFTSLALFQLLNLPVLLFPQACSAIADASNAVDRLREVFLAETFENDLAEGSGTIDRSLPVAVRMTKASFSWDSPPANDLDTRRKLSLKEKRSLKKRSALFDDKSEKEKDEEKVFKLHDIDIDIPRGQLCAIVGATGSGKSSLLQGLLGEMRRTSGSVKLGGSVGYCPQSAWIQNATVRENITFGRAFDETRYWAAIRDSCLERDLELLPDGDMTQVGEKGISLSGGQKQRVNICRTLYSMADILIFDDPLSALDAHVGKSVFQNVIVKNQTLGSDTTRILVTHGLHFLPQVDYIYTIVDGRIAELGTYKQLIEREGAFSKLVNEFGGNEEQEGKRRKHGIEAEPTAQKNRNVKPSNGMMQAEERVTGAVSGQVYKQYLKSGNGAILVPVLALSQLLYQGAAVMASYWLVYWQEMKFDRPQSFYMIIYSCLGIGQAIAFFTTASVFAFLSYFSSRALHEHAIYRIMHAPVSFFDTTPLGRISNRLLKDIDTIDNLLGDALRSFTTTFGKMLGAIVLISIVLPFFLLPVLIICIVYFYFAIFYRASARELKRLDALLRSLLYSHFSESLSGLATIRAYGGTSRFRLENERLVDHENRAYWLTIANQRWLEFRLDMLGITLTFCVAILAIASRFAISPSQTGLALSYILMVQASFTWMVVQTAEVENDMNAVERVVHYANSIQQEPPFDVPDQRPPPDWPAGGQVEFRDVVLKYRPELPAVLRNVSLKLAPGEKVGIIGRTGAGKSSITIALYRVVELTSGSIEIDGLDISKIGLDNLRKAITIIPQDPLLFSGTLRTNLDPFGIYDDTTLWDALRRSYLVDQTKSNIETTKVPRKDVRSESHTLVNRFTLETVIEDEGANLSVGQRSLVSLARALVKNSKLIVLDEATASVDYETDQHIQDTITTEFADRTVICIAHRLRTIIAYDRICVMDAGEIAEFDTPTNLFNKGDSIFRGMCDGSNINYDDIRDATKRKELKEMS